MGINKVEYGGSTLVDLTDTTVTPETLAKGVVAYNASGERIVGTMSTYEPFYIDCTLNQNGDIFSAVATSETPTQSAVNAAFAEKRPIYLRWEAAGIQLTLMARTPYGSGDYIYTFITISGDTTSTIQFMNGGFYNTYFVAQEKIAVVSDESAVQDGKITIVV